MAQKDRFNRRQFIKKGSVAALSGTTLLTAACGSNNEKQETKAPNVNFNKTYEWKMVTTWPPNYPILGEGCNMLAKWIDQMSGGRLKIEVFGAGELVPAMESFDAVSHGVADMGSASPYYWAGKIPAAQFFSTMPFGMNARQMNAWLLNGGGLELWEKVYKDFDLTPLPGGNTGIQMGGWFNVPIEKPEDLKGLKMRIPGIGGQVISQAGGSAVSVAGGEIYTNLERGVIDATEWLGPFHDYQMGFHEIADYYYYPGWHELGTTFEIMISSKKFESLPPDLKEIVKTACFRLNHWTLSEFEFKNSEYLRKIKKEGDIELRQFPEPVLKAVRQYTSEVIQNITEDDPLAREVYNAYRNFQENMTEWATITEKVYYNEMMTRAT